MQVIIDTDIGTDDAVALLLALRSQRVSVECITTVAGNVDVDSCVRNALYVLQICETAVPIYRGAATPLVRQRVQRTSRHADDGLGGLGFRRTRRAPADGDAVEALVSRVRGRPGALTLITLGPLTNIAMAVQREPKLGSLLQSTIVMGGAVDTNGTATPLAEFNIWADPEAADIVLNSGMQITLADIGLSCGECALNQSDISRFTALDTDRARFVAAMCSTYDGGRAGLPDAIATAIAIAPQIVTSTAACRLEVDTSDSARRGETRFNDGSPGSTPVTLVKSVDADAYKRLLLAACQ